MDTSPSLLPIHGRQPRWLEEQEPPEASIPPPGQETKPRPSQHAPVEEVVPANHPQKAGRVGNGVELVVHLFELLVHDVSSFALRLTAGTGPARRTAE